MDSNFLKKLIEIAGSEQVCTDEPMKQHTTFRIGGRADYFVSPTETEQIRKVIELCRRENMLGM